MGRVWSDGTMIAQRWRVLAGSSLSLSCSIGTLAVYSFSLFVKPLAAEFGWSRGEISMGLTLTNLAVTVTTPALGVLCDRFGSRALLFVGHGALGAGMAALAHQTPQLWQFYAVFLFIGLLGSATAPLPYARLIVLWFEKDRGLGLGITMAGIGLGAFVVPLIAQEAMSGGGWRSAYLTLALLAVAVPVPLNLLLIREREGSHGTAAPRDGTGLGEAVRTRTWWHMTAVFLLVAMCGNGVVSHLAAILTDTGVSEGAAAAALAVFGIAALAGRVLTGWLVDRYFAPYVAAVLFAGMLAGIALLRIGAGGTLAAGLTGIALGAEADLMPYLVSRYYGMRAFGAIFGACFAAFTLGMATGPLLMGYGFDLSGSYGQPLNILMALLCAAVALTAMLPGYDGAIRRG